MRNYRPHRFPPLSQFQIASSIRPGTAAELQAALADGFQQGIERGYREGHESGLAAGREDGRAAGYAEGRREGLDDGRRAVRADFDAIAQPLDALFDSLKCLQADYQAALRKEVVELVGKVARQVIRCELALQPVQMLALVDETLATMPPVREGVEVYLNPEELQRIRELDPERSARWTLIADSRLEPGECRIKADGHEADAGCRQRLAACVDQVRGQLLPTADDDREAA
ncbi:flagellar assembly protein FliH [Aromatoleum sp.]|uniref:flagellar assembly protein FliH n=1 Tax=Aromatoleum sp. TaxID=2307007 RepID=UPI002FC65F5B